MEEDAAPPILRLEIENVRPLRGRDLGRLIERLVATYERFEVLEKVPLNDRAHLRVVGLYRGSVIIDLAALGVGGAAVALSFEECRNGMRRFVCRLKAVVKMMKSDPPGRPEPAETQFIEAAFRPLRSGEATTILVFVHGDNDEPFRLDREDVERMWKTANLARAAELVRQREQTRAKLAPADEPVVGTESARAKLFWNGQQWRALIGNKDVAVENATGFRLRRNQTYQAGGRLQFLHAGEDTFLIEEVTTTRSSGAYCLARVYHHYDQWRAKMQATGETLDLLNPEFMKRRSRDFRYDVEGEIEGGAGGNAIRIRRILSSS